MQLKGKEKIYKNAANKTFFFFKIEFPLAPTKAKQKINKKSFIQFYQNI